MTPEELRVLLERADRSQAWLARHLGVRENTVWRWAHLSETWPIPESRDQQIADLLAPKCPQCGAPVRT